MAVVPVVTLHGFRWVGTGSGKNGLKAVQRGQGTDPGTDGRGTSDNATWIWKGESRLWKKWSQSCAKRPMHRLSSSPHPLYVLWLVVLHTVSSEPFWFNPDHFHRVEAEHRSAVMFLKS